MYKRNYSGFGLRPKKPKNRRNVFSADKAEREQTEKDNNQFFLTGVDYKENGKEVKPMRRT